MQPLQMKSHGIKVNLAIVHHRISFSLILIKDLTDPQEKKRVKVHILPFALLTVATMSNKTLVSNFISFITLNIVAR